LSRAEALSDRACGGRWADQASNGRSHGCATGRDGWHLPSAEDAPRGALCRRPGSNQSIAEDVHPQAPQAPPGSRTGRHQSIAEAETTQNQPRGPSGWQPPSKGDQSQT